MGVLKVVELVFKHGVKVFYYRFHTVSVRPSGLVPDASRLTLSGFSL